MLSQILCAQRHSQDVPAAALHLLTSFAGLDLVSVKDGSNIHLKIDGRPPDAASGEEFAMKFDRLTDEAIRLLARAFYEKVRRDAQLAPIFTAALGDDWHDHIRRMCDFWSTAMRISRRYKGDMLVAHRHVPGLHPRLFQRWLELFEQTIDEHFAAKAGTALHDRARKSARNLQLALFHPPTRPRVIGNLKHSGADKTDPRMNGPLR